jgi:hypothetical protein
MTVGTWPAGGAGIVIGLATYGYKIMRVFGVKSVKMTNSRGFCLELATAITVIVASRYGTPTLFYARTALAETCCTGKEYANSESEDGNFADTVKR